MSTAAPIAAPSPAMRLAARTSHLTPRRRRSPGPAAVAVRHRCTDCLDAPARRAWRQAHTAIPSRPDRGVTAFATSNSVNYPETWRRARSIRAARSNAATAVHTVIPLDIEYMFDYAICVERECHWSSTGR